MNKRTGKFRLSWPVVGLVVVVLAVCSQVIATGLSHVATNGRAGALAYELRSANSVGTAFYAELALMTGDHSAAQRLAREAIGNSPLNVRAIRVLGQARDQSRLGAGDALMTLSAELSWRDGATQVWAVQRALQANELEIAAQRAEALLRIQHDSRLTFGLVRLMLTHPPARQYFVRSLEKQPSWRHNFMFSDVSTLPEGQLVAMAALLRELGATSAKPSIVESRATIDGLVAAGRAREAFDLYRRFSGRVSGDALLNNAGFENADLDYTSGGNSTVFDWRTYSEGGVSSGVERRPEEAGNRVLYAVTDGGTDFTLAERVVVLAPGGYELSYRMRSLDPEASEAFQVRVHCADGRQLAISPGGTRLQPDRWRSQTIRFSVATGCPHQMLQVVSSSRHGASSEAFFDDIALTRAR